MHDNEALGLDPVAVTYLPTKGRAVLMTIDKPESYKAGEPFTSTIMDAYYDLDEIEGALSKQDYGDDLNWDLETARYCAQASYLERCYCGKVE